MKIVYMGTSTFAVPTLEKLIENNYEVGYVITKTDKARDRGKHIKPTPVKEIALNSNIDVLQPIRIKEDRKVIDTIKSYKPDFIVVAAYGQILSKEILDIPKYGCINIHGSLLPKYRGAAPIQRSIMNGDKNAGVTIMYMAEGMDTGDMLAKISTSTAGKTSEVLHDELAEKGAELLIETLPKIVEGSISPEAQNEEEATYAPMLTKEDGKINFENTAEFLESYIRGVTPWPGAYTYWNDKVFKIWEASYIEGETDLKPGTVITANKYGIQVATAKDILVLKMVQMPGKRKMLVQDFIVGNKIENNEVLG